jgi:imidazolonepropionase-like amidohydrolase
MTEGDLAIYAPLAWFGPGRTVRDAAVVTSGGEVVFAGPAGEAPGAARIIELDGFLMPAAADRHVHIGSLDPAAVLVGGVTAVRDMGGSADEILSLADASEMPTFNGPLIRAAGPMITAPGGYSGSAAAGVAVADPQEAAATVGHLADRGAAHIKVALNITDGPTVSDATLSAIVQTAQDRGLPVAAHAQGLGQVERALGAGVTELAHTPWTDRLPDATLEAMAKSLRIVSTLGIRSDGRDTFGIRTALDNLRRFAQAGGRVLYGTDMGRGQVPLGVDPRELLLMREAGLGPEQVLEALILFPIVEGAPADMIGLADSPFDTFEALGELVMVVRAGRVVAASDRDGPG